MLTQGQEDDGPPLYILEDRGEAANDWLKGLYSTVRCCRNTACAMPSIATQRSDLRSCSLLSIIMKMSVQLNWYL
jgi:hypothetical protein